MTILANARPPVAATLQRQAYLVWQLTKRDVLLKYRGSVLGIGWSFLYPLFLLAAFTLVFGGVFGGRWSGNAAESGGLNLALFIYCGMVVFFPFSEVMNNTTRLLLTHQSFVKKIIFPVELLPVVAVLSATMHAVPHLLLLALGALLAGQWHATMLLAPVVLLPVWVLTLGLAWLVTAISAYVRDVAHGMPILMQLLMFVLPVFYPLAAAPAPLLALHRINPLALTMEDLRRVVLAGTSPDWPVWFAMLGVALACAIAAHRFFMHCREEFADVL
jgi:lipopolysaccharide transport system permease protein